VAGVNKMMKNIGSCGILGEAIGAKMETSNF